MKVLFVFPIYGEKRAKYYTGGEKQFIRVAEIWKNEINIDILGTIKTRKILQDFNFQPDTFIEINDNPFISIIDLFRSMGKIIITKYDLIFCAGEPFSYMLLANIIVKRINKPLITSIKLLDETEFNYRKTFNDLLKGNGVVKSFIFVMKKMIRNRLLAHSDYFFVVSSLEKKALLVNDIEENRIHVTGSAIDPIPISNLFQEKIYDLIYVGSLIERKNITDLVCVVNELKKIHENLSLVIIGDGDPVYVEKIKKMISDKNLSSNIFLKGFLSEEEKNHYLSKSKIFMSLSLQESFGQSICEAMTLGLPVIAYDLPVYSEWYKGTTTTSNIGNLENLVEKTHELLTNSFLYEDKSITGKEISQRYNWKNVANKQISIMKNIVDQNEY